MRSCSSVSMWQGRRGAAGAGSGYEWLEPHREAALHQATDAAAALAGLLTKTDIGAARQVLRTAISHAPYTEALYQQLITLHHGDSYATGAIYADLTARLAEIDAVPSEQTAHLATR